MEWIPIIIVAFSVICALLYLVGRVRLSRMGGGDLARQTQYDSAQVKVLYEESAKDMTLYFQVDRLVLEREEDQRLDIPHKLIIGVTCGSADGQFVCEVRFRPEEAEAVDSVKLLSKRDLTESFTKLLPKEKITKE